MDEVVAVLTSRFKDIAKWTMRKLLFVAPPFFAIVVFAQRTGLPRIHPDYVPDEKTALRIAEVVLIGQFGEERVGTQRPLRAESRGKDMWLVSGTLPKDKLEPGAAFGVWVNRHDGCVSVMEHMK
jgi:NTF2 fold immunity protein